MSYCGLTQISQRQAACRHTRLTRAGSNQFLSRVTCCECRKVLVLLYHSVPDWYVQHAMEQRHRWQASRIVDLEHFPASEPEARADPSRHAHSEPPRSKRDEPAAARSEPRAPMRGRRGPGLSETNLRAALSDARPLRCEAAVNVSIQIVENQD